MDWNDLIQQFDNNKYHLGYLTHKETISLLNFPIKPKVNNNFTMENLYFLSKQSNVQSLIIVLPPKYRTDFLLLKQKYLCQYYPLDEQVNKKNALILAGMGQFGKNQLVYDYQFGFEITIYIYLIDNLTNLPKRLPPTTDYLPQCINCNDCINACPAQAIHGNDIIPWIDSGACKHEYLYGDNKKFYSLKYLINEILGNPIDELTLQHIQSKNEWCKYFPQDEPSDTIMINQCFYRVFGDTCEECIRQKKCSHPERDYLKTISYQKIN